MSRTISRAVVETIVTTGIIQTRSNFRLCLIYCLVMAWLFSRTDLAIAGNILLERAIEIKNGVTARLLAAV